MGSGIKSIGNSIGGVLGNATGATQAHTATPYKEFTYEPINMDQMTNSINQQANIQRDNNVGSFNAAIAGQTGINPALAAQMMGNNLASSNLGASQQAVQANAQANLQGQMFNRQMSQSTHGMNAGNYNSAMGLNQNSAESAANRSSAFLGGLMQGGGAALPLLMSDERLKESVDSDNDDDDFHGHFMGNYEQRGKVDPSHYPPEQSNVGHSDSMELADDDSHIHEFLNSLTPNMYKYKGDSVADDGGQSHLGVMAQNIEQTEAGQGIVKETENGKALDVTQLSGSLAAGLGSVHRRLMKLEGLKNA